MIRPVELVRALERAEASLFAVRASLTSQARSITLDPDLARDFTLALVETNNAIVLIRQTLEPEPPPEAA